MTLRANYFKIAPEAMQILIKQENYLREQFNNSKTLTTSIWELVKLRVSQINQCAYCIDMHSKDSLSQGETPERIIGLSAWSDMPLYTQTEQAALAWGEHLTTNKAVDDQSYQKALQCLGEQAVVDLTLAVNAINSWNRIAKAFKPEVGSYKPE